MLILMTCIVIVGILGGGYYVSVSAVTGIVLTGVLFYRMYVKKRITAAWDLNMAAFAVLVFGYLLSCLWAVDSGMALMGVVKFLPLLLFYVLVSGLTDEREKMIASLPMLGCLMTAFSFVMMQFEVFEQWVSVAGRLSGFFQYPNTYALFMLICLILVMWRFDYKKIDWLDIVYGVAAVFGIIMRSPKAIMSTLNIRSIFTTSFWYQSGAAGEAVTGINWSTIIFIAGMMIMVEVMAAAGFFRWLCMLLAKAVHYRTRALFITFMIMSFGLAMFIDSITVILFLAAVSIELAKLLKFNPVPMILSEIFCANLGGSATMCGDPPNIIIGTSLNFSFSTFITHTGLIAVISLVFIVVYFLIAYRKELESSPDIDKLAESMPSPAETITNRRDFALSCVIFMCAVVLLVTHALTGLTVAFIGLVIAIFSLIVSGRKALHMLKSIDYKTLLFFLGLFIVVGGLEQTGILEIIAAFIGRVSKGNLKLMVAIIIIISAFASALIDNIPFAATMVPVIKSLAATQGVDLSVLAWALSMGTDVGGSATPIGASANVVGTSVAAKNGYMIGWGKYCRTAVPATIIVVLISMVCIFVRYC